MKARYNNNESKILGGCVSRHGKVDLSGRSVILPLSTNVGLARTIYIRFTYGIFGREITRYTVIYSAYIQFWQTLKMRLIVTMLRF